MNSRLTNSQKLTHRLTKLEVMMRVIKTDEWMLMD